jgi:putative peptidoglycan lipid II flippase
LPPLSRAIQGGQVADYLKLIHFALSRSFSLIFPCSVAVLVLGAPAVNLIYGHGLFDFQATVQTTICLWAYGVGLMPAVLVLLLSPAFYAQKDFLTPLKASLVSVGLSILLNTILVFFLELGSFSIALATSVAAFVNYRLLSHKLKRVVGPIFDQESRRSCVKVVICSCLAGISTLLAGYYVVNDPTLRMFLNSGNIQFARELLSQLVQFLSLSAIFGLFLFLFAWLFKAEGILSFVRRKSLAN